MFTVEIRVNGKLVTHVTAKCIAGGDNIGDYDYQAYSVKTQKLKCGFINGFHKKNGINSLVARILNDVSEQTDTA